MRAPESPAEIDATAAVWAVRLESGLLSSAERRKLDAWLARSERHHGAYIRASAMWSGIGERKLDWEQAGAMDSALTSLPHRLLSRRVLIAGGVSIAAGIGAVMVAPSLRGLWSPPLTVTTGGGEQRRLPLQAGGSVLLNTNTSVSMSCARGACTAVELHGGEALFTAVAQLTVESRDAALEVLDGTFMMAVGSFGTRITVTRGLIHLMVDGTRPFELATGARADIASGTATLRRIGNEEIAHAVAWSQGYLVLTGESLFEAAAMINRYNRVKVELGPGAPAAEALVGRFSIRDPQGFAAAVAKLYGLSIRPTANALVLEAGGQNWTK